MLSEMGNLNTVSHWSNCRNHKAPLAGLSPFLMAANTFVYCSTVEADSSVFVVILNLCCHLLSHRDYNYAILASHFPVQSWANMTLSTKLDIHNDASREGLIPGHRQHAQKILWSLDVYFLRSFTDKTDMLTTTLCSTGGRALKTRNQKAKA